MMLRWVAAGILEAVKGFRRLKGYAGMPTLVNAWRARDRQLGLVTAEAIAGSRAAIQVHGEGWEMIASWRLGWEC
jgi:hypothetical protein